MTTATLLRPPWTKRPDGRYDHRCRLDGVGQVILSADQIRDAYGCAGCDNYPPDFNAPPLKEEQGSLFEVNA